MKRLVKICLAVALAATPVAAQQTAPPPTTPTVTQPVPAPPAQSRRRPAAARDGERPRRRQRRPRSRRQRRRRAQNQPRAEPPSSWQNVKIDVAITDSLTAEQQTKKTVTVLVLDGRAGQVRSWGNREVINVDVSPTIRPDGRIYLRLTLEYLPEVSVQAG